MLEHIDPDVVLITQSLPCPSMHKREMLPTNYNLADRKDRLNYSYEEVAIVMKLDMTEMPKDTETKFVTVSLPKTTTSKQ